MTFIVFLIYFVFFGIFQSTSIYGGDAGDLVTSAFVGGIAHPPGYPLYSLLGFLLAKIPLSTVAWRVGLISSIFSALTLTVIFHWISRITKSALTAFITASILALTYVYWLYSIVPEVFALNNFLSISLLYAVYLWSQTHKTRLLYGAAFIFGLGLAHHHIILFMLPAITYGLFTNRKHLSIQRRTVTSIISAFLIGLSPYLWAYISALSVPAIIWNDPSTLKGFITLITRAQYGTFQAGIQYAQTIQSRFLQFPIMLEFLTADFTYIGITTAVIGLVGLFKKDRPLFWYLGLGFMSAGPFFFFYASYIITSEFTIATMERFLLPSYLFVAIFIGYGIFTIKDTVLKWLSTRVWPKKEISKAQISATLVVFFFLIIPTSLFYINYPKLSILKNDRTAEKIGEDVLKTTEPGAIIFLQADTLIFNTQYAYYTESQYQDRVVIHYVKLYKGELNKMLKKFHPQIARPKTVDNPLVLAEFIEANYKKFPIYSTESFPTYLEHSFWIPQGILFRFYKEEDLPTTEQLLERNDRAWESYQDPLQGSLKSYKNLMLANVIDFYRSGRLRSGNLHSRAEQPQQALINYKEAIRLDPEYIDSYYLAAEALIGLEKCDQAQKYIEKAHSLSANSFLYQNSEYYGFMTKLHRNCFKDEAEAKVWEKKYARELKKEGTSLKEL